MADNIRGAAVGSGLARVEQWNGKEHLVVPVVGMVDGAIIRAMNSLGPERVRLEPFKKTLAKWEGKPLFLGHPLRNGRPVLGATAMSESFGVVRNPLIKDDKFACEAWMEADKAPDHLLERARAGDEIQISIGVLASLMDGEDDIPEWATVDPDHLAMLPGDVAGACNFDMGCGVRAASQEEPRFGWPDAGGNDEHGRGSMNRAAMATHEAAGEAHAQAAEAHLGAMNGDKQKAAATATREAHDLSIAANYASVNAGNGMAREHAANALAMSSGAHNYAREAMGPKGGHALAAAYHSEAANYHFDAARSHGRAARNLHDGGNRMENMYTRWLEAGPETDELLKTLRNIPQKVRDKMPKEDFAGPNESFPIEQPIDVHDAAQSLGRAKGDTGAIKARIIEIAHRKGDAFVAQLPDAWKAKPKAASGFKTFLAALAKGFGIDETVEAVTEHVHQMEAEMTKCEVEKLLASATPEQLKAAADALKPPTAEEIKAAADKKEADEKAAALKAAQDKKDATVAAIKATGKNTTTDEALKAMSQEQLDAMVKTLSAPAEPTFEELLAKASPETRAAIEAGRKVAVDRKAAAIKVLRESKRCDLTDKELEAKTQSELDALVKLADIKTATDFSGLGGPRQQPTVNTVAAPKDIVAEVRAASKNAKR